MLPKRSTFCDHRPVTSLPELLAAIRSGTAHQAGTGLLAVGWATVDIERTLADLAAVEPRAASEPVLEVEPALGARAARLRANSFEIVVLEPTTEGRLAAFLARHGEGVAVRYVEDESGQIGERTVRTALGRMGRLQAGPRDGPFVIVVGPE